MEQITFSWTNWIFALVLIVGLYFALTLLAKVLTRREMSGQQQRQSNSFVRILFLVYEPVALLLLLVLFVFVNPVLDGLLVAIVFLFGYPMIKNYVIGRFYLVAQKLKNKQHITVDNTKGVIQKIGYTGIELQTSEGLRMVDYTTLSSQGYTLLKGKRVGGVHNLLVHFDKKSDVNHKRQLADKLLFCPFIDWSMKPQINYKDETENTCQIEVLLRKEKHLHYLTQLLKDWGYNVEEPLVKSI